MKRLFLALLVVLVGVAYGCAEPPHGITLWHPYRGAEDEALQRSVEAFEKESHVKVTTLFVPYEAYIAKLEAAIPRGNGPDVFIGPHCVILPNVRVGAGSVIQAGTVVSRSVPRRTLWAPPEAGMLGEASTPLTANTGYANFLRGLRPPTNR